MSDFKIDGELTFNDSVGKFCIVDHEKEQYLETLEFGAKFQVLENDDWIDTEISIGSNEKGELVFKLKNTSFEGSLEGIRARM